ncbi:hypothetical protein COLO4_15391 [Corchorus olitorius]|uniref:LRAT domain-containing protein n=1 Tax=Corchorus olitorius TaxID=93759 RepID=A0A1R3JNA0_9ROSI|nr:hypothetical protein COLO4_15391 [Corchorus olitorius]
MGVGKFRDKIPCENCGHIPGTIGVLITCLDCFLERHQLHVYQYDASKLGLVFNGRGTHSSTKTLKAANEVIEAAFDYLKNQSFGQYDAVVRNCEHFATDCKTGEAQSNQVAGLFGHGLCDLTTSTYRRVTDY